jgi:hypothetical protein
MRDDERCGSLLYRRKGDGLGVRSEKLSPACSTLAQEAILVNEAGERAATNAPPFFYRVRVVP